MEISLSTRSRLNMYLQLPLQRNTMESLDEQFEDDCLSHWKIYDTSHLEETKMQYLMYTYFCTLSSVHNFPRTKNNMFLKVQIMFSHLLPFAHGGENFASPASISASMNLHGSSALFQSTSTWPNPGTVCSSTLLNLRTISSDNEIWHDVSSSPW